MEMETDFDQRLSLGLAPLIGGGPAKPPTDPGPAPRPRAPGVLVGVRLGDLEVGLLFYGGADHKNVWVHPGYGEGFYTELGDPAHAVKFPLHIVMSCGAEATYETQSKIPPQSRDCDCGNPDHRLVHYLAEAETKPA